MFKLRNFYERIANIKMDTYHSLLYKVQIFLKELILSISDA